MAVKAGYGCKLLVTKTIVHSNDIYNLAKKKNCVGNLRQDISPEILSESFVEIHRDRFDEM